MRGNTVVMARVTIGDVPLTISQDALRLGHPTESHDQNNYPPNGQFPTDSIQPIGVIGSEPFPGIAQQVPLLWS